MKKLFVLLLLMQAMVSIAQVTSEKRLEFDIKEEEFTGQQIHIYGKDGFLIRTESERDNDQKKYKYELYNTDFKVVKERVETVESPKRSLINSYETKTHLVDLFYQKSGTAKLISIEGKTLKSSSFNLELPANLWIQEGVLSDQKLYLYCKIKKKPQMIIIDWHQGTFKIIPIAIIGYNSAAIMFEELSIMEKTNEAFLSLVGIKGKKREFYVMMINQNGGMQKPINLSKSLDKKLTNLKAISFEENKYILTGTYASKDGSLSEGIYFAELEDEKINFITYHSFLDLKNFLSYLPQKRQEKIEKKKERMDAAGREYSVKYRIAGHDLIPFDGSYYYIGEAYYPTYRTVTTTSTVNGVTTTTSREVFDGYQYTHATLIEFSADGKIVWDQTFEMWPSDKPYRVKQFIKVNENLDDGISLVFASRDKITAKLYSADGDVIEDKTSDEITAQFKGDKTRYTIPNLEYW